MKMAARVTLTLRSTDINQLVRCSTGAIARINSAAAVDTVTPTPPPSKSLQAFAIVGRLASKFHVSCVSSAMGIAHLWQKTRPKPLLTPIDY